MDCRIGSSTGGSIRSTKSTACVSAACFATCSISGGSTLDHPFGKLALDKLGKQRLNIIIATESIASIGAGGEICPVSRTDLH